jgi:DNA-binding PadR family transcriptional regulator
MGTPDPRNYIPLPAAKFHILVVLSAGELHGYAIMQAVESSSDGLVKIGPASLYGTLKRLVDDGLAEEVAKPVAPGEDARRRYYRLSGLGARVVAAEAQRLARLVEFAHAHLEPGSA